MYLKVWRHKSGEVSVWECDSVHHVKVDDPEQGEGKKALIVNIEDQGGGTSAHLSFVESEEDSATIYLMNGSGRTIDTILWKIDGKK